MYAHRAAVPRFRDSGGTRERARPQCPNTHFTPLPPQNPRVNTLHSCGRGSRRRERKLARAMPSQYNRTPFVEVHMRCIIITRLSSIGDSENASFSSLSSVDPPPPTIPDDRLAYLTSPKKYSYVRIYLSIPSKMTMFILDLRKASIKIQTSAESTFCRRRSRLGKFLSHVILNKKGKVKKLLNQKKKRKKPPYFSVDICNVGKTGTFPL